MSLIGPGREKFGMNEEGWQSLKELAYEYGWEPAGTELCGFKERDGETVVVRYGENVDYDPNYFQFVTAEDARAMAEALDRAMLRRGEPRRKDFQYIAMVIDFLKVGGFYIA